MTFEHDLRLSRRALLRNGLLTGLSLPLLAQAFNARGAGCGAAAAAEQRHSPPQ